MNQTQTNRIEVVDALRGLALCAIVIVHCFEHYNLYYIPESAPQCAGREGFLYLLPAFRLQLLHSARQCGPSGHAFQGTFRLAHVSTAAFLAAAFSFLQRRHSVALFGDGAFVGGSLSFVHPSGADGGRYHDSSAFGVDSSAMRSVGYSFP